MSTRASVIITKNRWEILFDNDKQCLRHHSDGYPSGVGSDLVGLLKEYSKKYGDNWEQGTLSAFIQDTDDLFRSVSAPTDDSEYIYIIDTQKHQLYCYSHTACDPIELDDLGDMLFIPDNVFDGRLNDIVAASDNLYSKMFQSCSSITFDGTNVKLPNGHEIPVNMLVDTSKSSEYSDLNPSASPLYMSSNEKAIQYQQVFVPIFTKLLEFQDYSHLTDGVWQNDIIKRAKSLTLSVLKHIRNEFK